MAKAMSESEWSKLMELTDRGESREISRSLRLRILAERCKRELGKSVGVGFGVDEDDIPVLEECLALKSLRPLDQHVERLIQRGIKP